MGRPTDHPKDTMFRVRLDAISLEKLSQASDRLNLSKSEIVRKGIDLVYDALDR